MKFVIGVEVDRGPKGIGDFRLSVSTNSSSITGLVEVERELKRIGDI
jgi:hypothetical protein